MLKMRKRLVALGLVVIMAAGGTVSATASTLSNAQTTKAQAEDSLYNVTQEINEIQKQQASLQSQIDEVDQELVDVLVNIDIINDEIDAKKIELEQAKADLTAAKEKLSEQYESMKKRIAYMYENGNGSFFEALVGDNNYAELLNRVGEYSSVHDADRNMLVEYQNTKVQVENLVAKVQDEEEDLIENQESLAREQERLEGIETQLQSQMSDYDGKLAQAKVLAEQYKQTIVASNEIIKKELVAIQAAKIARLTAGASNVSNKKPVSANTGTTNTVAGGSSGGENETDVNSDNSEVSDGTSQDQIVNDGQNATNELPSTNDTPTDENVPVTDNNPILNDVPAVNDTPEVEDTPTQNESTSDNQSTQNGIISAVDDAVSDITSSVQSNTSTGSSLANYATQFVGNPYVWGGTSLTNGADCSGFVMSVYANYGYSLPHSSAMMQSCGNSVSINNIQPGDIVCYSGHVAIYIGNGQIVHASSPTAGIKISNMNYRTVLSVRRVL